MSRKRSFYQINLECFDSNILVTFRKDSFWEQKKGKANADIGNQNAQWLSTQVGGIIN